MSSALRKTANVFAALLYLGSCMQEPSPAGNTVIESAKKNAKTSTSTQKLVAQAMASLKAKRYQEALNYATICLKYLPPDQSETNIALRRCRASALDALGRHREALAEVDVVIAKSTHLPSFDICHLKTSILIKLNDLKTALKFIDEQIKGGSCEPWIYYERHIVYWQMGRSKESLDDLEKAISLSKPTDPSLLYQRANLLLVLGRSDEALPEIQRAIALKPQSKLSLFFSLRAQIWLHKNNVDRALHDVDHAISLSSNDSNLYRVKGDILTAASRPREAMIAYNRCLELNPDDASCLYQRARLNMNMPDAIDLAVKDYENFSSISKSDLSHLRNRSEAYQSKGRLEDARADISKILCHDPTAQSGAVRNKYLFKRGKLNERLNDPTAAIVDYNAILMSEKLDYVFARRALVCIDIGRLDGARKDLTEALEIRPDCFNYLRLRARVNLQSGNLQEALSDLDKCVQLDQSSQSVLESRAKILEQLGRNHEAKKDRQLARQLMLARLRADPPIGEPQL